MNIPLIRPSEEFYQLILGIKARCMMYNKKRKCPSTAKITKVIAEQIDEGVLWENEFNGK